MNPNMAVYTSPSPCVMSSRQELPDLLCHDVVGLGQPQEGVIGFSLGIGQFYLCLDRPMGSSPLDDGGGDELPLKGRT